MDVVLSFFCLKVPWEKKRVAAKITGCPDPEYISLICSAQRSQLPRGFSVSNESYFEVVSEPGPTNAESLMTPAFGGLVRRFDEICLQSQVRSSCPWR